MSRYFSRQDVKDNPDPTPFDYQADIYQKSLKYEKPSVTCDNTKWEGLAEKLLSANAFGYVYGCAGARETNDNKLAAFRKWGLVPNRLVPADFPDLSVELFGEKYAFPIGVAPVGVQTIFHRDGESATARAAAHENVPYILSTASSTSIEKVAEASGSGDRWYQLYWPLNEYNDITASLLKRAQASGFKALVITLDTYILGWRPSDVDNGHNPFLRADNIGVEIGFSDPVFQQHFKEKHGKTVEEDVSAAAAEWARMVFPGKSHCWEDIKFLQLHWDDPIVLKGIQTVADAKRAVAADVQGIVVSNHGGRQVDGCIASLDVLPEIAEVVGDYLEIIFDSGIRSGADVAKALALGAKMVLIGRPFVYGLALQGRRASDTC